MSTETSTSADTTTAILNCHPSVWQRLNAIVDRRKNAKSRERDLVKHRREVENELEEIGEGVGTRYQKLCVDHWKTIKAVEGERTRIQTLADLLETSIIEGRTGKLYEKPEDLDAEINAAEAEEEPELVKHAREEREAKKKQESQILKVEGHPSGELIVGRTYRFTSKTDPAVHCLGVVQGFEDVPNQEPKVWIQASDFSAGFPENKREEGRQVVVPSTVIWLELTGGKAGKGKKAEAATPAPAPAPAAATPDGQPADDGTGVFTFPGVFVLKPERHGAPPLRVKVDQGDDLIDDICDRLGLEEADAENIIVNELKGEVYLSGKRIAKIHPVAGDEEIEAKPAAAEKKPARKLEEVRDPNGRKKKGAKGAKKATAGEAVAG